MTLNAAKKICSVFLLCAATTIAAGAQTFTTVASFSGTNGKFPRGMALVQGVDGNFYGTTQYGGANCNNGNRTGCGVVFKVSPTGKLTRLYSFCSLANCADGYYPLASLLVATNGKLYGTTSFGGSSALTGCGTVFEITPAGTLTTLHTFNVSDGCTPEAGLIQAANGNFYGTTNGGGLQGGGTVFEMTPAGQLTTLHVFCSTTSCEDGFRPTAGLVQATDGSLYGTTSQGGNNCTSNLGCGTVFKVSPAGRLTTVYSFCSLPNCADGQNPLASLIQATNGNFYGTTSFGGASCPNSNAGCGTAFEITPTGSLTTLYDFCSQSDCTDGLGPDAPLVQATDGNFYGTAPFGGNTNSSGGTVFEITPADVFTTLYSLCSSAGCPDGDAPLGGLLQATNGLLYGASLDGGASNDGIVFSVDNGLGPFVAFVGNAGKVGQKFGILGQGLTGTTSVRLNGLSATFTAQADTLLVATVPPGATTGYVSVTTPSGTLTSNVPFNVIP